MKRYGEGRQWPQTLLIVAALVAAGVLLVLPLLVVLTGAVAKGWTVYFAAIHERAVELFGQPGAEYNYEFELKHKAIIDRFGRFPHRNAILGRTSTPEELDFLKQPGSSF